MGKGTDKAYITHSEWSNDFSEGGMSFGGAHSTRQKIMLKRLPFSCCSLSLQPFDHPVANKEGVVFDLENIITWLKKYKNTNPVTGEPLALSELVHLHFSKNSKGNYHCPITFKEFTDSSRIVGIRTSGNVYSYDAVKELNFDPRNWRDLLDESITFTRKDIITLQDPTDLSLKNLEDFWYVRKGVDKPQTEGLEEIMERKSLSYKMNTSDLANRILKEMKDTDVASLKADPTSSNVADNVSSIYHGKQIYTDGQMAASVTSTSMSVTTKSKLVSMDDNEFMYNAFRKELKEIRQKIGKGTKKATRSEKGMGYVQLKTTLGNLNLELYCEQTPKTCHNFLMLCSSGYYNGVIFHRSIKQFMIQGGDPTGTGRGGESYFKENFEDEIRPSLSHDSRGVLSMANRGPNTNSSQFFITLGACKHLDGKHSIFGRLVGGLEVLNSMEVIPTNEKTDRPLQDITIIEATVFNNPFSDWQRRYDRRIRDAEGVSAILTKVDTAISGSKEGNLEERWLKPPSSDTQSQKTSAVGRYLKSNSDTFKGKQQPTTSSFTSPVEETKRKLLVQDASIDEPSKQAQKKHKYSSQNEKDTTSAFSRW